MKKIAKVKYINIRIICYMHYCILMVDDVHLESNKMGISDFVFPDAGWLIYRLLGGQNLEIQDGAGVIYRLLL